MNTTPIIVFLAVLAIAIIGVSYGGTVKTYNPLGPSASITPSPTITPIATPTPNPGKHHHKKRHSHINTRGQQ